MTARAVFVCAAALVLLANSASAARYQKTKDGKTLVWNSLRGVAQEVTWSGLRDLNGYATGEGTLTWLRLDNLVNRYTGKMVRGKFEGPVIREQGNTRLQANFANGEKVGGWLEPGSTATNSPAPTPNEEPENAETRSTKSPSSSPMPNEEPENTATPSTEPPLPSPSPTPSPTPTPTPTPTPIATPSPTPTPTPIPSPILSPTPTPRSSPSPTPTPTVSPTPILAPRLIATPSPTPMPRLSPFPTPKLTPMSSPISGGPIVEASVHSLELASAPPHQKTEEPRGLPPLPKVSPTAAVSAPGRGRRIDPNVKRQIIADFKKQIDYVLGQVRDATGNFHEIDRLEQVKSLPPAVSSHVTLLANQARLFQAQVGYEVTFYECLAEIQTVDALGVVDEATRDIAAKDTPTGLKTLSVFRTRYSEPTAEGQKALWHYLASIYSLCERLKAEAEEHLVRARSLESQGKKEEALKEYREISRIYPNAVTVEKIHQLENHSP